MNIPIKKEATCPICQSKDTDLIHGHFTSSFDKKTYRCADGHQWIETKDWDKGTTEIKVLG